MNKQISKYTVTIKGDTPLILHKYVGNIKTSPIEYEDEWKKTTYLNNEGNVIMPIMNIQACMFNGGKSIKKGRGTMAKFVYSSCVLMPLAPEIFIDNKLITLENIEKNGWINVTGAVVGTSRIDRIRTMLPEGWTISFQLQLVSNLIKGSEVKEVLENAGFVAGLGDTRPSSPRKPGPYGRFEVINFESI